MFGWKNFMAENFLEINRYFALFILQHDWPIEQCLLHVRVFFGGKTKRPRFDLFIHWLIKQITNTYRNQFSLYYFKSSLVFVLDSFSLSLFPSLLWALTCFCQAIGAGDEGGGLSAPAGRGSFLPSTGTHGRRWKPEEKNDKSGGTEAQRSEKQVCFGKSLLFHRCYSCASRLSMDL